MQLKKSVRTHMPRLKALSLESKPFGRRLEAWVARTAYSAQPLALDDEFPDDDDLIITGRQHAESFSSAT